MSNESSVASVPVAVRALPLCFKDELNSFATDAGIALESLQYRLADIGRAELGKLAFKDGKPGIASISKGAGSVTIAGRKVATIPQGAHASIGFWREMQAASAYSAEFPTAPMALSIPSRTFVEETCERIAEQENAKARDQELSCP